MLAFSAGAILLYCSAQLPDAAWLWGLFSMAAVAAACLNTSPRFQFLMAVTACGALGAAYTQWHVQGRLAQQLPTKLEMVTLTVNGYACSVPREGSWNSVQVDWCVTAWPGHQALPGNVRLRLRWYGASDRFDMSGPARLTVRLKRPHGSYNTAGFRYERWLFRHGYYATGTIRSVNGADDIRCGWSCQYHRWRTDGVRSVVALWRDHEHAALAEALIMGSRGALTPEHWQRLKETGTAHLVAISGLHIGLMAALAAWVARTLGLLLLGERFGPRAVPLLTAFTALSVAGGYALMAGMTIPTQRALIMVAVGTWTLLRPRLLSVWDAWLIALVLVLLLDPFAPLAPGFWLSFGAVAVLLTLFWGRARRLKGWRALVVAQLGIGLMLWPLLSALGLPASPGGFVANLLAVPWMSLGIMPLLLPGVLLLAWGVAPPDVWTTAVDWSLELLWRGLEMIQQMVAMRGGSLSLPHLDAAEALLLVLAFSACLLPFMGSKRMLLLLALLLPMLGGFHRGEGNRMVAQPEIRVFDVGQGLAVLVRSGDRALLYDTGPESPSGFNAVESYLLPSFAALGVRRLDWLVLSHGDSDHAGAWEKLPRALQVERIVSGEPQALQGARTPKPCPDGQQYRLGQWNLSFWQTQTKDADANGLSCVLALTSDHGSALLMGDAGIQQEREWLSSHETHSFDVLLAGHHGSRSASSAAFAEAVAPRYAVYSSGYRNHYGHPHPDVLNRFDRVGATNLTTAGNGELRLLFRPDRIAVEALRDSAPFWIAPARAGEPKAR
ncbi:DNA internalization-related competence protein ComEC/Rec2 [Marinobacteraceae bacterium S3BR75-40.1]